MFFQFTNDSGNEPRLFVGTFRFDFVDLELAFDDRTIDYRFVTLIARTLRLAGNRLRAAGGTIRFRFVYRHSPIFGHKRTGRKQLSQVTISCSARPSCGVILPESDLVSGVKNWLLRHEFWLA